MYVVRRLFVDCLLFYDRCSFSVVRCLLFCLLRVVRCSWFVVCCLLIVVRFVLFVVGCWLVVVCRVFLLFVARFDWYLLFAVCRLLFVDCLFGV